MQSRQARRSQERAENKEYARIDKAEAKKAESKSLVKRRTSDGAIVQRMGRSYGRIVRQWIGDKIRRFH